MTRPYRRMTAEQIDEALEMRDLDWPLKRIAAKLGFSITTIFYAVNGGQASHYVHAPIHARPTPPFHLPNVTDPSLLRKITSGRA